METINRIIDRIINRTARRQRRMYAQAILDNCMAHAEFDREHSI